MRYALLLSWLLLLDGVTAVGQPAPVCDRAEFLADFISKHHIRPPSRQELATRMAKNGFRTLDPFGVLFTQDQINRHLQDPALNDPLGKALDKCQWLGGWRAMYSVALNDYAGWLEQNLGKPLLFSSTDSLNVWTIGEHPMASAQLHQHRMRLAKYQVLERMRTQKLTGRSSARFAELEASARAFVLQKEKKVVRELDSLFLDKLLPLVAQSFDPHTTYFKHQEAEEFKASLSTEISAFGFSLQYNDLGELVVMAVQPGSPAWKSNEIHEGDVLVSLAEGNDPSVVQDMSPAELYEKLGAITRAQLTIRKKTGALKTVELQKEVIENRENTVSAILLEGEKKVGYLSLPSFYSSWSNDRPKGIAQDVAQAIMKLNREKIDGLIIDLFDNGGGSISEAVELIGIFIDFGTVGVSRQRNEELALIRDMNKGIIYGGPLMIMVNSQSASASELLASSLQDLGRAIIVGQTTFGKGTGQQIFTLPDTEQARPDMVKITNGIVYRVFGSTYQKKGVIPDIEIGRSDGITDRESALPFCLESDSIRKKVYVNPKTISTLSELRSRSNKRQAQDTALRELLAYEQKIKTPIALTTEGLDAFIAGLTAELPQADSTRFKAKTALADQTVLRIDAFQKNLLESQLKDLETSVQLQEAFQIMVDYLNLQK